MTGTKKQKIIVIAGPTSVGKTSLSVELAKKIGGEIISADSRQVYKGLTIGTGKVKKREMKGVPHYLLDVADPKRTFDASQYVDLGRDHITEIGTRNRIPIVVGGTGFYMDALLGNITLTEVPPNKKLRKELLGKNLTWLQKRLKKLDPRRYKTIDTKNPVRLMRAIEIATALGKVPLQKKQNLYNVLYIGLTLPLPQLKKKIHTRLLERMQEGMLSEARRIHKRGVTFKRMEELGLEYRFMAFHLQGKLTKTEMLTQLESAIGKYAQRQMTWFKKNKKIQWFSPTELPKIIRLSQDFSRE